MLLFAVLVVPCCGLYTLCLWRHVDVQLSVMARGEIQRIAVCVYNFARQCGEDDVCAAQQLVNPPPLFRGAGQDRGGARRDQ